jgi:hypothetical protein
MKSRIHNFESYLKLNEASVASIASDFPAEWKRLEELGFYDSTTPIVAKNGNIILKNRRFDYYPEGIVLQPGSGYVRDRGVRSGFLKNGLDLKGMLDYLIDRYSKYESQSSKTGLSEKAYGILRRYASDFKLNPSTGRIDSPKNITLTKQGALNVMEEGIKFGEVGGFSLYGREGYNRKGDFSRDLSLTKSEAKDFLPTEVKGQFKIWDVVIGGRMFRVSLEGKWNPVGKLDLMLNGKYEEQGLCDFMANSPEEVQEMIHANPAKMAVELKSIWKELKKLPGYSGLEFPEGYSEESDLLADLNDIGL